MKTLKTFVALIGLLVFSAMLFVTPLRAEVAPEMRQSLDNALNSTLHIRARGAVGDNGQYSNWSGTGYIVAVQADRVIIATNCHVACSAVFLWVTNYDGSVNNVRATFITGDDDQDIAFISVPRFAGATAIPLLMSDPQLGETALALGGPLGLRFTVTEGIISRPNRDDTGFPTRDGVHQTDAAVNPGNSGGPLVVERGGRYVVAGMNTFIVTRTGQNIGLGFAVPSTDVHRALAAVLAAQTPTQNSLGISLGEIDREMAQLLGVPQFYQRQNVTGAYISLVEAGSVAEAAGLQPMDILVEVGTKLVRTPQDAVNAVRDAQANQPLRIRYVRNGGTKEAYIVPSNAWESDLQKAVETSLVTAAATPAPTPVADLFGFVLADPGSPAYLQLYAPVLAQTGYQLIGSPVVAGLTNGGKAHEAGITVGQFVVGIQFVGLPPMQISNQQQLLQMLEAARQAGANTSVVVVHLRSFVQLPDGRVGLAASAVVLRLN